MPTNDPNPRAESAPSAERRLLAGKYRLGRLIGEGGMGSVYEGEHIGLRSKVAVKLLGEGTTLDDATLARFRREARAMGAIRHDNVVTVMDVDTDEDGTPFLVMEHLEGETLSSVLRRERHLSPSTACGIVSQVLAGLAAAHARGITHRDLKPGNIFIAEQSDGTRRVKILDFGVSKLGDTAQTQNVTADGVLIGTPNFMAPEQVQGRHDIDCRADLYAAGVILYRAVTGHLPYSAPDQQELYQSIVAGTFKPPRHYRPEISQELEAVILKAMHRERDHRFQDAKKFRTALLQAMPHVSIQGLFVSTRTDLVAPLQAALEMATPTQDYSLGPPTQPARPSSLRAAGNGSGSAIRWGYVWTVPAVAALVCGLLYFTIVHRSAAALEQPPLRVGVIRYLPTDVVERRHKPLVKYLAEELGRDVELVIADDHDQLAEMFLRGELTLAALSPYNYVRIQGNNPDVQLLASPVLGGNVNTYEGLILTRTDAGIDSLEELKGKVFCYVDPGSSSGYLYPRAILIKAGIDPDRDFKATRFGGNHLLTLRYLARGQCDGAAVFASILYDAKKHSMEPEMFRVLASTNRIPVDAYCAPGGVSSELAAKIQRALLKLTPDSKQAREVFAEGKTWFVGFAAAHNSDYDTVRDLVHTLGPEYVPPIENTRAAARPPVNSAKP